MSSPLHARQHCRRLARPKRGPGEREVPIPTATPNRAQRHLAIVGGGTAGHVYPALAVAAAFRRLVPDSDIRFLGTELGFEGRLVPAADFPLELIPGSPLFGSGIRGKLRAVTNTVAGMRAAAEVFERAGTEALLSFGGYASAGAVLAARRRRLPIAICEPNVAPGLTNRVLARCADAIFVGWPQASAAFRGRQVIVTGIPIRAEVGSLHAQRRSPSTTATRLLILGGSLGSSFLNRRVPEVITELTRRGYQLEIQHQTGALRAAPPVAYAEPAVTAVVTPFVDDIVVAYEWADLAVSSAGAITLAELAAAGLPAFVVPLAAASEDHQVANADAFEAATGCPWMRENEWELRRVADRLEELMVDHQRRAELRDRLQHAARVEAAADIARGCLELMKSAAHASSAHGSTR